MAYKIKNHKLEGVDYVASPNTSGKFRAKLPDSIIIHYTAGGSLQGAVSTLTARNSKASAHVVVGRDGKIVQLVPFDTVAWHAGVSSYGGRSYYNQYSIGIEIDNAGELKPSGSGYLSWFNKRYGADEVVQAVHRNQTGPSYWHVFTEEQIETVQELCETLMGTYDIKEILGHEEIAPGRKTDPGPAFPLDKLRERLLGEGRSAGAAEELPVRYAVNAVPFGKEVQEFLNTFPGIKLKADGVPGRRTSDAFMKVFGRYLLDDPRG